MPRARPNPPPVPNRMPAPANAPGQPAPNQGPQGGPPGAFAGQARQRANLRPAGGAPVVVVVAVRELSGAAWVARFPGSRSTDDLVSPFRENVASFISALQAAGATVTIAATLRPPERAFLMHWSWKIINENADPQSIPARAGVDIKWDHVSRNGTYSSQASIAAARAMVNGYGIQNLQTSPALTSRHIAGNAIDMSISWGATLTITDADGSEVVINEEPRTGMNTELHTVGRTYGVTKFTGGAKDKPHWSTDGR